MAAKIKVILNTYGGRLTGQAKIAVVKEAMRIADLEYDLDTTNQPKHGIELARQAAEQEWSIIVAAGGDGTVNHVVNGMMRAAKSYRPKTLAILPLGTANDLADMLRLPRDITAACQCIAAGNSRLIDLGMVNGYYFANNSAVGLEPMVSIEHDKMRWITGNPRYIFAALKVITQGKSWDMRLDWGNGIYEGPVTLVSVGNSPRTGGSFFMTPQAKLDDGLLDFVYAVGMSRLQMIKLLPKTFTGKHIHHPMITYLKTDRLSITASPSTPIQADGELIDHTAVEIEYQVAPEKLRVIV